MSSLAMAQLLWSPSLQPLLSGRSKLENRSSRPRPEAAACFMGQASHSPDRRPKPTFSELARSTAKVLLPSAHGRAGSDDRGGAGGADAAAATETIADRAARATRPQAAAPRARYASGGRTGAPDLRRLG